MILHGEQETEVLSHPIPLEGNFVNKSKVIGVYDKGQGKGAVIVRETLTVDSVTNKKIFRNVTTIFVRGLGGFGVRVPSKITITITTMLSLIHGSNFIRFFC